MGRKIDDELVGEIVKWLRAQVDCFRERGWEVNGYVVGLSGGLDSSVTAALCKKAFPENTRALYLPLFSERGEEECAREVAEWLDVNIEIKNLETAFRAMTDEERESKSRAAVKLRSKLRMAALYLFADSHGLLVCGTANLDERELGYFTRWGDGACDVFPLGGLHKIEVERLGRLLGVPERVLGRPSSPGFFPGQTAEGELGFSYREAYDFFRKGKRKEKIEKRVRRSLHKTRMPPVFEVKG